ncbi:MAG TPA: ribose 5-phosphate isomerase B, partial [Tepidisphaeraceae bacterium]|jgi:ribose 5-phosphate isomerase B
MNVAIGCDHRGFECKRKLIPLLKSAGHKIVDLGCESTTACDYPDYAIPAAKAVADGTADVAILIDSSGIGMSICANKICGVRAAVVHDEVIARLARDANHCNVMCLPSDLLSLDQMMKIVEAFLTTPYSTGRHVRRIEKIAEVERQHCLPLLTKRVAPKPDVA